MRRSVKSHSELVPVDAHDRTRDYVTEEELLALVEATRQSRHHWRDAAMLMLTFYHGLRASELCNLQRKDVDLKHGRLWVARVKGSLSTEQPLLPEELRVLKRYLKERSNAQLPWLFLRTCSGIQPDITWLIAATTRDWCRIIWVTKTLLTRSGIREPPPHVLRDCGGREVAG
jgi:integrase